MYTSTLEKIDCKVLFTWLTRRLERLTAPPPFPHLFFVLLSYFFAIVSFVTTTLDKFQFRSQVRLSQINVLVPIRLKPKVFAVFIKIGSRIDFLFVVQQDIVNYWDFPSKTSRNCHKMLEPKSTRLE